ncbi:MAG TPA: hypothetical protein VIL85_19310 [Thermomicrobiales bacterium]|jgi:hypothetical protein
MMQTETRPAPGTTEAERPTPAPPRRGAVGGLLGWPIRALGRTRERWYAEDVHRPAWQGWFWTALLVILLAGTAYKLGALDWYTDYPLALADGTQLRLPNSYASIDHPFHIAKERATVDALKAGRLPAWFSDHQGGFPAEFYPTGGDLLVALAYLLALQQIPLSVVHKLVVIGVFLLPAVAYWAIARREKLPLSVALLAALLHLFVRGNWLAGGSREIIDFGLWPDVFASYLPLFLILWGADWLRRGDRRGLVLAVGVATLAVYTNPRSTMGLAAAALALGIVTFAELLRRRPRASSGGDETRVNDEAPTISPARRRLTRVLRWPPLVLVGRAALLSLLIGMLSAALLLPLRDNQSLYQFTIYFRFERIGQVWSDPDHGNGIGYIESVLPQLIALAGLGLVVGLLRRGFYTRVFAVLLPLSYLLITLVGWTWQALPVFAQLEGQRLMPLLRPATIFLAALGAHEALRCALRLLRQRGGTMLTGAALVTVAAVLLLHPSVPISENDRGLPLQQTTDQPAFTAIARSAALLNVMAKPGDKPLVIGNNMISWHDSFWITALTGRDLFHNDWLWFWRPTEYGYQELLQNDPGALDAPFLAQHGITMVLIDAARGDLLAIADTRDYFTQLDAGTPGGYALYRVNTPPGPPNGYVIPDSGAVTALAVTPERLTATMVADRPGNVRIITNDFPRWRAWRDGQPIAIARTNDGYMSLPFPAGESTIELRYITSAANWAGRGLVAAGLLAILGICLGPALRHRWRQPR